MNPRVIKVIIEKEPELYEELMAATLNHTQFDGCYVMQYNEDQVGGWTYGTFMLCDVD